MRRLTGWRMKPQMKCWFRRVTHSLPYGTDRAAWTRAVPRPSWNMRARAACRSKSSGPKGPQGISLSGPAPRPSPARKDRAFGAGRLATSSTETGVDHDGTGLRCTGIEVLPDPRPRSGSGGTPRTRHARTAPDPGELSAAAYLFAAIGARKRSLRAATRTYT